MSMLEILRMNLLACNAGFRAGIARWWRQRVFLAQGDLRGVVDLPVVCPGAEGRRRFRTALVMIALPAAVTIFLGCITPLTTYLVLRRLGRFSVSDLARIAAHYGSVSAVTFIAAQQFAQGAGSPPQKVSWPRCSLCWKAPVSI